MSRRSHLLFWLLLCSAAPLLGIDAARDFSGRWVLDQQTASALAAEADRVLVVAQKELALQCSAPGAGTSWSFSADGSESKYQLGAESRNTVAKWEGAALLINTLVSGPRNYAIMDRWKLSRDYSVLTIERQAVANTGQTEAILVYRRDGTIAAAPRAPAAPQSLAARPVAPAVREIVVPAGTRIPLALVNSLSTKRSLDGDRVYLETAFPIVIAQRIVIPRGSYVAGTVTRARKSGRVAGKGELFIRFDSLTLPNGVTRDFRARVGNADAGATGEVDRQEGKISGEGNRSGDARTVARDTGLGTSVGGIAGAAAGHAGAGAGIGAAAGAAAGLASVLLSRGPGVVLPKGTTLEMILDRDLRFKPEDLKF